MCGNRLWNCFGISVRKRERQAELHHISSVTLGNCLRASSVFYTESQLILNYLKKKKKLKCLNQTQCMHQLSLPSLSLAQQSHDLKGGRKA